MTMRPLLTLFLLCMSFIGTSQVGINTNLPDPSAVLEIQSETQGLLTPRMTSVQRTAITSPATGLMVYDTTVNSFQYFNGTDWIALASTTTASDYTGWGDYVDSQYTSASPFIIGVAGPPSSISPNRITLPNNAGVVRDLQKPLDVGAFYDNGSQTITGRDGDGVNIVIEFKARPNTNLDSRLTVSIDIGTPVGEIYKRDFVLSKGFDQEHFYLSSFNAYTLNTWEANGGGC